MADLVVAHAQALIVSAQRAPLADGWVAISGGRVERVGQGAPPLATETIDARGHLVLPGLVNAHHHLFQGASRAVPAPGDLPGWLETHYARWACLDAEDVAAAAALSIAQLLVRGCTTVAALEFLHPAGRDFVSPVTATADRLGIRLLYVRGCTPRLEPGLAKRLEAAGTDPGLLLEPEETALARTRSTVSRPGGERLRWACGPTTPVTDDGGAFQAALNDVAAEAGVAVHTHFHPLSRPSGGDAYALAGRLGLVRRGNWLAHGSRLEVTDVARLGADGVGVVHCPSASLTLGYPLPPLAAWRAASDRVAVAVDGAASNDRGSLPGEAQLAYYTQQQPHLTGQGALPPGACLDLVTRAAARTIGWPGAGSLEPGSLGDVAGFTLRDLDSAGAAARPGGALLRFLRTYQGARASFVLVGGRAVVADGRLATGDERSIAAAANRSAERLDLDGRARVAAPAVRGASVRAGAGTVTDGS